MNDITKNDICGYVYSHKHNYELFSKEEVKNAFVKIEDDVYIKSDDYELIYSELEEKEPDPEDNGKPDRWCEHPSYGEY